MPRLLGWQGHRLPHIGSDTPAVVVTSDGHAIQFLAAGPQQQGCCKHQIVVINAQMALNASLAGAFLTDDHGTLVVLQARRQNLTAMASVAVDQADKRDLGRTLPPSHSNERSSLSRPAGDDPALVQKLVGQLQCLVQPHARVETQVENQPAQADFFQAL